MRSGLYCQMGDYNKALQDANRMLKLDPKSPFAYHDLGLVYKEVAKPKEAIVAFTKALELSVTKDGKASNYYHRGSQYASIGEYQKCIDDSTRSLEIGGRRVDSLAQRAISYQALNQHAKAVDDFTTIIQNALKTNDMNGVRHLMHRAYSYEQLGKFDKAIADYSLSSKYQPADEICISKRAIAFSKSGKHFEAIKDFTKVIELDTDGGWRTFLARGKEYAAIKEYKKAISDYNKALEMDPPDPATIYEARAKAFQSLGDSAKANADLGQARKVKSNTPF